MEQLSTAFLDQKLVDYGRRDSVRSYLGASVLGDDERINWLRFRGSWPNEFPGRLLRLFSLGNMVEDSVIKELWKAGMNLLSVDKSTGKQWKFKALGGHLAGNCDGFITGFPGAPEGPGILEVKSMNARRFAEWKKKGVRKIAPEYYAQGIMYAHYFKRPYILFVTYNKDTSELGAEVVMYDEMEALGYYAKAERLITSPEPPAPASGSRSFPFDSVGFLEGEEKAIYFGKQCPKPHCRNCRFATPLLDGDRSWACSMHGDTWDGAARVPGQFCDWHNYIPALVPAKLEATGSTWAKYRAGRRAFFNASVPNRNPVKFAYASSELYGLSKTDWTFQDDEVVKKLEGTFGAAVFNTETVAEPSGEEAV
jgi:hypothetical protein